MERDLDTFLTVVYCSVDEVYQQLFAPCKPRRPGKQPTLSDSEVLTLSILAQWQQDRSERAFGASAARHWRRYFPRLLSQSQFNRRSRDLCAVLCALGPAVACHLAHSRGTPAYEVLAGVPVPLMRRCRGDRHRCFGIEAQVGRGGSDKDWYYGVTLVTSVNDQGLITGFVVGPATTEERWLAETLLRWRADPTAPAPRASDLADVLPPRDRKRGPRKGPRGQAGCPAASGRRPPTCTWELWGMPASTGKRIGQRITERRC